MQASVIREKTLGQEHPSLALSFNNLAALYYEQGNWNTAQPMYERALSIWEKTLGPESPEVAAALNNLATLNQGRGRPAEAEPLLRRSLAIWEKVLGPGHPDLATLLNNYTLLLRKTKCKVEALTLEAHVKQILAKNDKGSTGEASTVDVGDLAGMQKAWKQKP